MWNHLETEKKLAVLKDEIRARTGRIDWCRREVGGGRDGSIGGITPRGVSGRLGVGKVAAKSRMSGFEIQAFGGTHIEMSPGGVSPLMRRRQASWVSWIISIAYFLFLASPEKANWFSGFPSGIL